MKIDLDLIEYDVKKSWNEDRAAPVFAVRAEHPGHRRTIGHGTGDTAEDGKTAARKNLVAQLLKAVE